MKPVEMLFPERQIGGGSAAFPPLSKGSGDMLRGVDRLRALHVRNLRDRCRREPVPPFGELSQILSQVRIRGELPLRGSFTEEAGVEIENGVDDIRQIV